jgi:hypothetical protein
VSGPSKKGRGPAFVGDLIPPPTRKARSRAVSTSKRGQCYKLLETQFQRGGFSYKQIAREKDVAIFEQAWRRSSEPSICWEVVIIRRHSGKTIKGHWVEPSEFYPSSSEWGKYGFTFPNRDKALAKFFEMSLEEPAKTGKEVKNGEIV